ncbi:alginate lyase family protein [Chitinophaga sp. S165]|uniref:alginate lyase family protein n=1 Tax=Chitinophaga sp. S165 TaxID=2135462 RepID=UPI000D709C4E|nr:alginate lyase family protein [Chitinophaga sp. S165]PWV54500.1 alginate lyase [Chitinophaga sp. S165]
MKHVTIILILIVCCSFNPRDKAIIDVLRKQILAEASTAMRELPMTVTTSFCERSAGGKHDFYSEGDYWWPDPAHPDGPYIQRDGMTNPNNFVAHRQYMIRFSKVIGTLASAYRITGDQQYVSAAIPHLRAWFTDTATLMHPDLQYAQAIKGRFTGRGIGIIDAIHLMEVAQGVLVMQDAPNFDKSLLTGIQAWFKDYLTWVTTHQYGKDEMNAKNNHGTCWVMQVACFAQFTGDTALLRFCADRFKNVLLPNQMAADGSFPLELARTKPYGYSLFNLDAMVTICQILSDSEHDVWDYQLPDGRSIKKGIEFMYTYVADKKKWVKANDVMYFDEWPVAQPFLVFGARQYGRQQWFDTWKHLDHQPKNEEVIRNLPVRNPLIWF